MLMEDYDKRLQTIQRHFWKKFIKGRGYKEQKASTMKLLYTDRPSLSLSLRLRPWLRIRLRLTVKQRGSKPPFL